MKTAAALLAILFLPVGSAPVSAASSPVASSPPRLNVPCDIDPAYLPRTADAAASWMATCYEIERLPRTADAVDHWLN